MKRLEHETFMVIRKWTGNPRSQPTGVSALAGLVRAVAPTVENDDQPGQSTPPLPRMRDRAAICRGRVQRGQASRMQLRNALRKAAVSASAYVAVIWPVSRYTIVLPTTIGHSRW